MVNGLKARLAVGGDSARSRLAEAARTVQEVTVQHPFPFQKIPVFDVLSPETIAGAGFFVKAGGKTYAVTAKHPHRTVRPTEFVTGELSIPLGELVRDADDVLCFAVQDLKQTAFTLIRPDGVYLKKGDLVTVICHDGPRSGTLNGIGLGMDDFLLPGEPVTENIGFTVPGAPDFKGNSGAPVVLNKTGEVLGVVLNAADVGRETMLEFAPLSFNAPFAPKPLGDPATVFSLALRERSNTFVTSNLMAMFPPELLAVTIGMPMEQLWQKRPFLPAKGQPDFYGESFSEWLGKRNGSEYLFHEAGFVAVRGRLKRLELRGYGWTTNVPAFRVESLFNWFFETLGAPARALDFTKKDGRPGYGAIYCYWTNSATTLSLGAQATGKDYGRPRPWVSLELKVYGPERPESNPAKAVLLPADIPSLQRELRDLLRRIAELPTNRDPQGDAK
jgi:hypothetical protein